MAFGRRRELLFAIIMFFAIMIITPTFCQVSNNNSWPCDDSAFISFSQATFAAYPTKGASADQSLIGYWKTDEGLGSIANDSSGNGNAAVLYGVNKGTINNANWVHGVNGTALSFNGVNSSVSIQPSKSFNMQSQLTIACWIKLQPDPKWINGWMLIVGKSPFDGTPYALRQGGTDVWFTVNPVGSTNTVQIAAPGIVDNNWHFVVGTYDGSLGKIYVDGALVQQSGKTQFEINQANVGVFIGGYSSGCNVNGTIDNVSIFNRCVTLSEIQNLYKNNFDKSGLVGEWLFDESIGNTVNDEHMWAYGKFGKSVNFDGVNDYMEVSDGSSLLTNSIWSVSAWLYPTSTIIGQTLFSKYESGNGWIIRTDPIGNFQIFSTQWSVSSQVSIDLNVWQSWSFVCDGSGIKFYKNGYKVGYSPLFDKTLPFLNDSLQIGGCSSNSSFFTGKIDELRVYNRTLGDKEVTAFYVMGPYSKPDPSLYLNYDNFSDSVSYNNLLIHVDNSIPINDYVTDVRCQNFFISNKLIFTANNTATINFWTNLGHPLHIFNGIWNSENYTTTLNLIPDSIGEVDWNQPPSVSNLSLASTFVNKPTVFSALWTDNDNLSGGGYIFSTNNTGQWVNASWIPFKSNPDWGNASLTLDSNIGVVVGFREYANNSLNLWCDSGIYAIKTTALDSTPTSTPSLTPMSTPTPTASTNPKASPTSAASPAPTLTSAPKITQTNSFPTEIMITVVIAAGSLVAGFTLAFKKGYIAIEVVDEEKPRETQDDYTI